MRAFLVAVMAWSVVVFAWVLFYPADMGPRLGCMHLVGRSLACDAQQDTINSVWWQYHTLPMLIGITAGYAGIVIVRLAGLRRRRPGPDGPDSQGVAVGA